MKKWTRALYQPNLPLENGRYVTASEAHVTLSRQAAEEGMVLLNILHTSATSMKGLRSRTAFPYMSRSLIFTAVRLQSSMKQELHRE